MGEVGDGGGRRERDDGVYGLKIWRTVPSCGGELLVHVQLCVHFQRCEIHEVIAPGL